MTKFPSFLSAFKSYETLSAAASGKTGFSSMFKVYLSFTVQDLEEEALAYRSRQSALDVDPDGRDGRTGGQSLSHQMTTSTSDPSSERFSGRPAVGAPPLLAMDWPDLHDNNSSSDAAAALPSSRSSSRAVSSAVAQNDVPNGRQAALSKNTFFSLMEDEGEDGDGDW